MDKYKSKTHLVKIEKDVNPEFLEDTFDSILYAELYDNGKIILHATDSNRLEITASYFRKAYEEKNELWLQIKVVE